ncbi:acyl-CoA dehydrogenase family protein [Gluconobacter japonicus]|uniref:Acyl-CoA dehydrogenase n=1 Tax=Gluconobacter japonicus TaxID=376620 RepID=A0ABQ5WIL0_GLUJA|nr:acyl-CoA dehydrogenase family protein [Gluconobacter japonicus]KXV29539.1 acyl-CoA dehydrogenase [Gluconobacter japonicus]GBR20763.1 acyl-CoA dehydrogenase [Gluconobacter japonicus NBRC 3271]GLQ59692.1 acyl-CoA dehydrogenase [Gluconobacter japonicus]
MGDSPFSPTTSTVVTDKALNELVQVFTERAPRYDRSGNIAVENLHDLHEAGFLALALPKAAGGEDISLRTVTQIVSRLAQGDPSTALILAMQYLQSGAFAHSAQWSNEVKQELFESIRQEGALINALRVEPELGTPARGGLPDTTVSQNGSTWRISGRKIFSTGSTALQWGVVWAKTDDAEPKVGPVLVPLDLRGVRIEKSWHQLGMRATGSHTIIFDNVEIPERYLGLLAPSPAKETGPVAIASWHAIVIAGLYNGIAIAARDWLVTFLHSRVPSNLGASLATLPRFHILLGEIDALLLSNEALINHAITLAEQGTESDTRAGLAKQVVTENAIAAVSKAVAAIGNPGLSQDNPLERHYRNVLCGRVHTPQGDSALLAAGREALKV